MFEFEEFIKNISIDISEEITKSFKSRLKNNEDRPKKSASTASKGGYRPILVDQTQLRLESDELGPQLRRVIYETAMCDRDKVAYFTLAYLNQRYANTFLESWNPIVKDDVNPRVNSKLLSELPLKFKSDRVRNRLTSSSIHSLFDVVNCFDLHSVPYSARFTLVHWYHLGGKFDLVLFVDRIPSSKQVLNMQAQSKRCVSLIANKLDDLVMGERDPFSFLLHDLVHAYKMFSNDYLLRGQVGFCRALLKLFPSSTSSSSSSSILDPIIAHDAQFHEAFNYLISDMNSHPRHMFFYLKAILIVAVKRKHGLTDNRDRLAGASLVEFDDLFERILDAFEMNDTEKDLARKLIPNDEDTNVDRKVLKPSNSIDFTLLDNFFLNLA